METVPTSAKAQRVGHVSVDVSVGYRPTERTNSPQSALSTVTINSSRGRRTHFRTHDINLDVTFKCAIPGSLSAIIRYRQTWVDINLISCCLECVAVILCGRK